MIDEDLLKCFNKINNNVDILFDEFVFHLTNDNISNEDFQLAYGKMQKLLLSIENLKNKLNFLDELEIIDSHDKLLNKFIDWIYNPPKDRYTFWYILKEKTYICRYLKKDGVYFNIQIFPKDKPRNEFCLCISRNNLYVLPMDREEQYGYVESIKDEYKKYINNFLDFIFKKI